MTLPKLTLFGRSLLLFICEIIANAVCWATAGILFGRNKDTTSILTLALLAWDYGMLWTPIISGGIHIQPQNDAIDNATRGLISQEQLPVTCGLFFSLGHSTIVLAVIAKPFLETIAIAISSGIYDRMQKVGDVGGIIGASISGSFLFVIGLANTIVLWQIIGRRRRDKIFERRHAEGESVPNVERDVDHPESRTLMMRILGPIVTFVNRPWKMYPVGFLFGLGFDTASSVALLSVSALGKRDANGAPIPSSHIIILPLLFTAGMTLIDTSDSILMLYSYSGIHEKTWKIFTSSRIDGRVISDTVTSRSQEKNEVGLSHTIEGLPSIQEPTFASTKAKMNVMSELSIILTLMSILVAFAISLITIMGLIGENCRRCVEAADADERHGGLAGRWWRAWASASDVSEYIGAAIVGVFVLVVLSWYGGRWALKRFAK
ncbi:high-affinity nickel-transport protein-domain-containing protein [Crepidotus variabilis]|uniref:Nickel/cobalt efflux system n=1 Tax=Crepidotus variabilis TaxID=179855 RepID=A0A9P6E886_9AGAR|nr:high-affinity nickel-transport protein-domain-containing protein [Crepidotus variabilis]